MTRFPPGTSGVTIYSQQFSSGNLEFGEPEISEKTKNKMKVRKIVLIKHLIGLGPRLDHRARIQFRRVYFGGKPWKTRSLSSWLTAFKLSLLRWRWRASISQWWRGRSKAVSLSEQTCSSSSSSTTPRCAIAKNSWTSLEEEKSLTDFFVCVSISFLCKSHWLISLFVFQYYFFAKSDLDLSIDFFLYLFCIFQIILLPNILWRWLFTLGLQIKGSSSFWYLLTHGERWLLELLRC